MLLFGHINLFLLTSSFLYCSIASVCLPVGLFSTTEAVLDTIQKIYTFSGYYNYFFNFPTIRRDPYPSNMLLLNYSVLCIVEGDFGRKIIHLCFV